MSTIEFMIQRVNQIRPFSIIDVGCGDGRLTRELYLGCKAGSVLGLDYSTRAIRLAGAMNADCPEIEFLAVDITDPRKRAM